MAWQKSQVRAGHSPLLLSYSPGYEPKTFWQGLPPLTTQVLDNVSSCLKDRANPQLQGSWAGGQFLRNHLSIIATVHQCFGEESSR